MEDRRVRKTKKNLKSTFTAMLDTMPFEQISVTELCRQADTSRITFYTHYSDKYALVDDIFQDMLEEGTALYYTMKEKNNSDNDPVQNYCNMLQAILDLYYSRRDFSRHVNPERNPYLAFSFYNHVLRETESRTRKEQKLLHLNYSPKQVTVFICYGLAGFVNESQKEQIPFPVIKEQAEKLLRGLLTSEVLVHDQPEI